MIAYSRFSRTYQANIEDVFARVFFNMLAFRYLDIDIDISTSPPIIKMKTCCSVFGKGIFLIYYCVLNKDICMELLGFPIFKVIPKKIPTDPRPGPISRFRASSNLFSGHKSIYLWDAQVIVCSLAACLCFLKPQRFCLRLSNLPIGPCTGAQGYSAHAGNSTYTS